MTDATLTIRINGSDATLTVTGHASVPELLAVRLRAAIVTLVNDPDRLASLTGCDVRRLSRLIDLSPSRLAVDDRPAAPNLPMMPMVEGVN